MLQTCQIQKLQILQSQSILMSLQLMHKMNGDVFAEIKDGFMYVTVVFEKV